RGGRPHRGDQQAGRRDGPDLRAKGVPEAPRPGCEAAPRDPGRLPLQGSHDRVVRAVPDPDLSALLGPMSPLRYDDGGSAAEDRPAHVRAASAVRRWGERLVLVQDDVHVLALRDAVGRVWPRLLPW